MVIDQQWIRRGVAIMAWVVALSALTACGTPTTPSSTAPFSQQDVRAGAGVEATNGKKLTVNYTGWLYDRTKPDQKGLVFDTSYGRDPFTFTLGAGDVIKGWDMGLEGLRVGGIRRLIIPPSLAYGGSRSYAIPPYATLVFDVELIEVSDSSQ